MLPSKAIDKKELSRLRYKPGSIVFPYSLRTRFFIQVIGSHSVIDKNKLITVEARLTLLELRATEPVRKLILLFCETINSENQA